ncbi:hypothetical protein H2201_006979 [Coniosporium apollinis]|uniref:Protein kinase domain-containing protein n=1 Tax=Coniosporium apollinis TaxID=61459 RepID=A0ABQ9NKL7_9PEZI|nr:hypothetical protein H2201_006979 [Coniosporium apollinis]
MTDPSDERDRAIEEFKRKVREFTVEGACGRSYIRVEELKNWMRSRVQGPSTGKNITQVDRLLRAAYRDGEGPFFPITAKQVERGHLVVFSILLELNKGKHIDQFKSAGIDDRLPVSLEDLKSRLKGIDKVPGSNSSEQLAVAFERLQWRYCPLPLEMDMSPDCAEHRIIPICKKGLIKAGGTAKVWQILVQKEFVDNDLQKAVCNDPHANVRDKDFGPCYQFALKTFEQGREADFTAEKAAFYGLRHHDGMIRYLGHFTHLESRRTVRPTGTTYPQGEGQTTPVKTYNILLEYGELDLEETFAQRQPPVFPDEIESFWKALFEVADAVDKIHNLKVDDDEYHGWHADIKPANILNVLGRYKLADPGFARFQKKKHPSSATSPRIYPEGGTITYGAPERHWHRRDHPVAVSQMIDTWSLGCVFSMAATWVVLGYQGIGQFHKVRKDAVEKITDERAKAKTALPIPPLRSIDTFHDGREVLADVRNWHTLLRSSVRQTDTITSRVLHLVDQSMLVGDEEKRATAGDIYKSLKAILSSNNPVPMPRVTKSIMDKLVDMDKNLPSTTFRSTPGTLVLPDDCTARKKALLDTQSLLMKTSHRSEVVGGQSNYPLSPRLTESIAHETIFEEPAEDDQRDNTSGAVSFSQHGGQPVRQRGRPDKVNVIQAYEATKGRGIMKGLKGVAKDDLLSHYFKKKNRDIRFLVDNADSMDAYWDEATFLLEVLFLKLAGQDDDGVDLSFTQSDLVVSNKKSDSMFDTSSFRKAMEKARPKNQDGKLQTDMGSALQKIFSQYLDDAAANKTKRRRVKNLTLIVLTDGIWEAMRDKDQVERNIVAFVKELEMKEMGKLEERPVSIEFIQLGDNPTATERLKHLDNGIVGIGFVSPFRLGLGTRLTRSNRDMIDHEVFAVHGDIHKMLLGSFVEAYDLLDPVDNEDTSSPMSRRVSPTFEQPRVRHSSGSSSYQTPPQESFDTYPRPMDRRDSDAIAKPPRGKNTDRSSWLDKSLFR